MPITNISLSSRVEKSQVDNALVLNYLGSKTRIHKKATEFKTCIIYLKKNCPKLSCVPSSRVLNTAEQLPLPASK